MGFVMHVSDYLQGASLAAPLSPRPSLFLFTSLSPRLWITGAVMQMTIRRIETGTPEGDALGFSGNLFSGWLEMVDDQWLYLHYVISRRKNEGNIQALFRNWINLGYDLRIVMPRPIMRHIGEKFGFSPVYEYLPSHYENPVEVWYRKVITHGFDPMIKEPVPDGQF